MPYLALGIALAFGLFLMVNWYVHAEPGKIVKVIKWSLIGIVAAGVLLIILTRQFMWLFFALPALLPWLMRARQMRRTAHNWSRARGARPTGEAQQSEVETEFLRVKLDHETGEISGEVTRGLFTGRSLEEMSLDELIQLLADCRGDEQSIQVLSAFLDRYHADWRDEAESGAGGGAGAGSRPSGGMTREEAYEILGLQPGASDDEIKAAHKALLNKMHPDRGGSTYLAAKINQAKDLLLGH
jgi:DnaJ-domain-containing protein 1